jgi:hypothetical protein
MGVRPVLKRWFVLLIGTLLLSACAGFTPTLDVVTEGQSTTISVAMTEADVRGLIALTAGNPAWIRNFTVNFSAGQIIVRGQVRDAAGRYVPATATVQIGVADNWLTATATAITVGGWIASPGELQNINAGIANALTNAQTQSAGAVVEAAILTDALLTVRVRVPAQNNLNALLRVTTDETHYNITVTLTEASVQAALLPIFGTGAQAWLLNPQIDLREGDLHITGGLKQQQGDPIPVTLGVALGVTDGKLTLTVTALSLGFWSATPANLADLNADLAAGMARGQRGDGSLQTITITNNRLSIQIRSPKQ